MSSSPPQAASRLLSILGIFFLPLALTACGGGESEVGLRFTAIPDQDQSALVERFTPLAEYLERELGVPVEYVPLRDYPATVEAFRSGDVQLAWFGGLTGVQSRAEVEGARALAQGAVDPNFRSYFIANASTGLQRSEEFPEGLRGRSFTFGARDSTSGRLMPEHFVRTHTGQRAEEFFAQPLGFSGAHDQTARDVANGTYEAGVLNFLTYDAMVERGELDADQCRVVWVTPGYPDYNWTAHPLLKERFGADVFDRLQAALVGLEDAELLSALERPDGLIPAADEDYAPVALLAAEMGFLDE